MQLILIWIHMDPPSDLQVSGDNPCSLAGLGLQEPGDVAVSLGTSDTMYPGSAKTVGLRRSQVVEKR
jgi:hypothetical protein